MIIVGANTEYRDGRIEYWIREQNDIASAKEVTKSNNEAIYCSNHGIVQNWFMFHDTSTDKSWSVYGIGLTKSDYITETTESFIRRIKTMSLPTYNKSKRRTNYEQLPKGAYVIKIVGVREDKWPSGDRCLKIAFDIAEGPHKGIYANLFEQRKANNENAQWPFDGVFTLNVPADNSETYVWTNWNSFFADLEDSNSGFVFDGDLKKLKGKVIGGKFHIKQSKAKKPNDNGEYPIYSNTVMKYSCVAEDVRQGKAGKLPNDVLLKDAPKPANNNAGLDGFLSIPDGSEDELPF